MNVHAYKRVDIDSLKPWENNPRTHSQDQIKQIRRSIREFGFTNPLLIDESGLVIAGHGRVEAAKREGLTELPAIELQGLSEAQKRALVISDNQIATNAGWDENLLRLELDTLKDDEFDLSIVGFTDEEVARLLADPIEKGLTDPDDVPHPPINPVTVLGDVWLLGNHRVMCGDSTSIDAVDALMAKSRANFCFSSPPYNAGNSEKLSGNTHTDGNKYGMYQDNKSQSEYVNLLNDFCATWLTVSDCLCVNIQQLAGNKFAFITWLNAFISNFVDIAIWDKGHGAPQMAKNVMSNRFEYLIFLSNQKNPSRAIPCANFQGTVQNVYCAPSQRNNEFANIHAATFPLHLPEWAIQTFTKTNSIIADAFGGTGTTLIASEKNGRVARLMELDPKYVDVIVQRWQDFTGKQATLESDGRTFDEIAGERRGQ